MYILRVYLCVCIHIYIYIYTYSNSKLQLLSGAAAPDSSSGQRIVAVLIGIVATTRSQKN